MWVPLLNSTWSVSEQTLRADSVALILRGKRLWAVWENVFHVLLPVYSGRGDGEKKLVCPKFVWVMSWKGFSLPSSKWEFWGVDDRSLIWHVNASFLQSSEESVMTTTWISVLSMPGLDCGTAFSSWCTPSLISVFWWSSLKGSYFQEVIFWSDYSANGKIIHSTSSLITNLLQNVFCEMRLVSFRLIVPAWKKLLKIHWVFFPELESN